MEGEGLLYMDYSPPTPPPPVQPATYLVGGYGGPITPASVEGVGVGVYLGQRADAYLLC